MSWPLRPIPSGVFMVGGLYGKGVPPTPQIICSCPPYGWGGGNDGGGRSLEVMKMGDGFTPRHTFSLPTPNDGGPGRLFSHTISSYRSDQSGFFLSINLIFHALFHLFVSFSLLMAPSIDSCTSYQTNMHSMELRKSFYHVVFVFPDSAHEVRCYANIQGPVLSTCKDVDAWHFHICVSCTPGTWIIRKEGDAGVSGLGMQGARVDALGLFTPRRGVKESTPYSIGASTTHRGRGDLWGF